MVSRQVSAGSRREHVSPLLVRNEEWQSQDLQLVWNVSVRHIKVHLRTLDAKKAEPAASMLLDIVFALVKGRLLDEVDCRVAHKVLSGLDHVRLVVERVLSEVVDTR